MDKKVYFISDMHLGVPSEEDSRSREKAAVRFLDSIKDDCEQLFIMGDLFDFWYEYKRVVPKGFVRIQAKLAEFVDAGIPVMLFAGNHDIWTFSYLQKELGIQVFREPEMMTVKGKRFFLVHGDGRGKGDNGYKFLKWLFEGRLTQFLFRLIHPDIGLWIGLRWSMKHRVVKLERERKGDYYAVVDKTRLYRYAEAEAEKHPDVDFFVFGHQHKGMQYKTGQHAMTTIVGNWMWNRDYAVFDGNTVERKTFQEDPPTELT